MEQSMPETKKELPALLIIDMVKDNFDPHANLPITPLACEILGPINRLIGVFRQNRWPVIFATDAYHRQDFIFLQVASSAEFIAETFDGTA